MELVLLPCSVVNLLSLKHRISNNSSKVYILTHVQSPWIVLIPARLFKRNVQRKGRQDVVNMVTTLEDTSDVVGLHLAGLLLCTVAAPVATESTTKIYRRLVYNILKC